MAPPELARDAPVADVVHPLVVSLGPVGGDEFDAAVLHHFDGLFGQRLRLDEPLRGDQRLDRRLAALARAEAERVVFHLDQRADFFERGDHLLAGFEAVETGVGAGGGGHLAVLVDDLDLRQIVAAAGFEIVEVVRGRDLHHAGAEFGVGEIVEDDGDLAIHERQLHGLAVQIEIARVFGVDGDGGIAEHGLGPRGGDGDEAAIGSAVHGIADVPQVAGDVGVGHFEIGERGVAAGAPVDHVLAAVDEAFFVQADEDFADGAGEARVEGEALAAPVAARAQADHLALDGVAVLLLPLPDALFEFFAAQVAAVEMPSSASLRSTTIWVAMPAWSVPGSQRVLSPSMRRQRMVTSISVCSSMWPMCSDPVTLGGGMTSENTRPGAAGLARKMPESIQDCAQCGSNR